MLACVAQSPGAEWAEAWPWPLCLSVDPQGQLHSQMGPTGQPDRSSKTREGRPQSQRLLDAWRPLDPSLDLSDQGGSPKKTLSQEGGA